MSPECAVVEASEHLTSCLPPPPTTRPFLSGAKRHLTVVCVFRIETPRWMIRILGALAPFSKWWLQELGLWSLPSSVRPGEMGVWAAGGGVLMWVRDSRQFGSDEEEVSGVLKEPSDLPPSFPSDTPGCGEGPPSVSETLSQR